MLPHAGVALFFALLAVALTWPLAARLATHVPGAGPDDNMMFLWNAWWMRQVLADSGETLFHTRYLFHPGGVDLVLHTHAAVNGLLAGTVFGALPLAVAFNLTTLLSCALNGFSTYLLAWRAVRSRLPAVTAGVFLAGSPALAKGLHGHFNLYSAWILTFFVLVFLDAVDRRSVVRAGAAGLVFGLVGYAEYYYFVYACVFILCLIVHDGLRPVVRLASGRPAHATPDVVILVAAGCAAIVALLIWRTGGLVVDVAGVRVSMTSGRNIRALAAGLVLVWLWRRLRPRLMITPSRQTLRQHFRIAAVALGLGALTLIPVAMAAADLLRAGGYVSQAYMWRNAPAGADIGTLVLGNPFNSAMGRRVMEMYGSLGMNAFAGPLWFGIAPLVLIATWREWGNRGEARRWLFIMAVFLMWTLGPYLLIFGLDTGLPLPQVLLRYVPVVANARTPAHAVVFVALGMAVLLAVALGSGRQRGTTLTTAAVLAVLLLDFCVAPFPMHRLEAPSVYARLASLPAGAVLELPIGMRDGFGEEGRFDPNVLYYQTLHGKPLAGGYISRLSPAVRDTYRRSPFGTLLRLSAGQPFDPLHDADVLTLRNFLVGIGIRYVVVNRTLSGSELLEYVGRMSMTRIEMDGQRQLFGIN